ncbi:ATP-binding protein [Bacillus sp. 2205SS5-2]|uniref:ATP-binding protein n=1 Tax=Bacillus sp. 2205SS5-2 TaxID=3109031 RepID=UPI003007A92A
MNKASMIAIRISLLYSLFGVLWIFLSDKITLILAHDDMMLLMFLQRYKGWVFIVLTGGLIYLLIFNSAKRLIRSHYELEEKEQQLERSKQHYQSLYNHNPDAVFELDPKGRVKSINPEGEKILGFSKDYLKQRDVIELIGESSREDMKKHYQKAIQGLPQKFETVLQNGDQQKILLRTSLIPIIVHEQVKGVFGIARDITRLRENEKHMIRSEKMAVIGQLAAAVAHEIRNPLTSLKGFVQLMQTTKEVNEDHLSIMYSEIERINLIAGEMLILGKQEDVRFKKRNISEILAQVMVLMEAQANLDTVTLDLENRAKEDLWVMCDPNQLKQVLINIIKNSLEAIPDHGHISIELNQIDKEVEIRVKDNGVGINTERLTRLGEPFYSTKEKGTGLGLTVSYRIIEQHYGSLKIESEKGKGTVVIICLPLTE